MYTHRSDRRRVATLVAAALFVPALAAAQTREVIGKEISVGRTEALLDLDLSDRSRLEIAFEDGAVRIDDRVVGSYRPGDALDAARRSLLGRAVALEDGPLGRILREWAPPATLKEDELEVATAVDHALEDALSADAESGAPAPDHNVDVSIGDRSSLLKLLMGKIDGVDAVKEALDGLGDEARIHIGEDVDVPADERIDGSLVVIEGDVRVAGVVDGDVVVIDGTLNMLPGARILGDVRLVDGQVVRDEDATEIMGRVVDVQGSQQDREAELRDRLREEIRRELHDRSRRTVRGSSGNRSYRLHNPFQAVFRGIGGVIEDLIVALLLVLAGAGVVAFAPDHLETVAETARRSPGRAAVVGMAGAFLLLPVWILGGVALAVSIVGIPVLIAWIPLFPLAAAAGGVLGYLAVARNVGEWLVERRLPYTGWIRPSNALYVLTGGILALLAAFIVADALSILPFVGVLRGLLLFAGWVGTVLAVAIGFGAVLLTRAGRRSEYAPLDDFEEDVSWGPGYASPEAPENAAPGGPDSPAPEAPEGASDVPGEGHDDEWTTGGEDDRA